MAGTIERNQIGKREDLLDLIATADAADRPFMAMVSKGKKMANMRLDWQADKFDAVKPGGVADGVDVQDYEDAAKDRRLLSVYGQQFRRSAKVGNIAEDVSDVAGASSGEMARALDKKREEISRDIEAALCGDQDTQLETDEAHPYLLRGLGSWLTGTAQTTLPVDALYLTPAASLDNTAIASVTEDATVRPVLKSIYQNHGKSEELTLLCGTDLKEAFTNFTKFKGADTNTYGTIRTYADKLDGGKITNSITLYEGDFNKVKLVPSLWLARSSTDGSITSSTNRRGYVLPMDQVQLRPHTFPVVEPLPNLGGGKRAQLRAILALQYSNPLRGGKFYATS